MLFTKFRMVDKAKQLFLGRDSQFVVDVARMGAHRGLRDVKALGNVGVAVAAPEECEQLSLSRSEAVCGSQLVATLRRSRVLGWWKRDLPHRPTRERG